MQVPARVPATQAQYVSQELHDIAAVVGEEDNTLLAAVVGA